jgi:hypothetical protein
MHTMRMRTWAVRWRRISIKLPANGSYQERLVQCSVVWCGVVEGRGERCVMWYDVMWYDVIWYDVMWCDVMWCDVMWCDVMWRDVMWCDVMWCDVMWCDVMWCDVICCDVCFLSSLLFFLSLYLFLFTSSSTDSCSYSHTSQQYTALHRRTMSLT